MKVRENKGELDYRMVKMMCSLEGGFLLRGLKKTHFKSALT